MKSRRGEGRDHPLHTLLADCTERIEDPSRAPSCGNGLRQNTIYSWSVGYPFRTPHTSHSAFLLIPRTRQSRCRTSPGVSPRAVGVFPCSRTLNNATAGRLNLQRSGGSHPKASFRDTWYKSCIQVGQPVASGTICLPFGTACNSNASRQDWPFEDGTRQRACTRCRLDRVYCHQSLAGSDGPSRVFRPCSNSNMFQGVKRD